MNIASVNFKNYQIYNSKNDYKKKGTPASNSNRSYGGLPKLCFTPSFGYCEPHMRLMKSLNNKFADAINVAFSEYGQVLDAVNGYNAKINAAHRKAAQMLAQYANYQYSMAEVIPSYAMESAPEVVAALSKTKIFTNPIDIMQTISNIPGLETKAGIDKNTGIPYTPEQMRKSKANTQLYSTVMLLEMLDKNMSAADLTPEAKSTILELRKSVLGSISAIYGKDAYDRIQVLKKMGTDASIDDKKKSLELVREFDEKAQELRFSEDFDKKLEELISYQNMIENRTEEARPNESVQVPAVTLKYHTHPQSEEHHHDHSEEHSHDYVHEHGIEHQHPKTEIH